MANGEPQRVNKVGQWMLFKPWHAFGWSVFLVIFINQTASLTKPDKHDAGSLPTVLVIIFVVQAIYSQVGLRLIEIPVSIPQTRTALTHRESHPGLFRQVLSISDCKTTELS